MTTFRSRSSSNIGCFAEAFYQSNVPLMKEIDKRDTEKNGKTENTFGKHILTRENRCLACPLFTI